MLAKIVVAEYGEKAEFVEETFSTSALAKKFGITFYPAVFVNEVLIAKPTDFFGNQTGRYIPWRDAKNQEKFRSDLKRMIELALTDQSALAREGVSAAAAAAGPAQISQMPEFVLNDLAGNPVDSKSLVGAVTLVEFWATWCPPCRSTLAWLGETKRKYGDKLNVLGIAVESEEKQIREMANGLNLPYPNVIAASDTAQKFGDILSVPTMFLFNKDGRVAQIFYGAPPDLHEKIAAAVDALLR